MRGYGIVLNDWIFDKRIKSELGLLCYISSLTAEKGYCFASNEYFSKMFCATKDTISRKISKLENLEYITIEYEKRGCQIEKRFLYINMDTPTNVKKDIPTNVKKDIPTNDENDIRPILYNNITSTNITSVNKEKNKKKKDYSVLFVSSEKTNKLIEQTGYDPADVCDFWWENSFQLALADWQENVRVKKKCSNSLRAWKKIVNKLKGLSVFEATGIIDASALGGWSDIYPPKMIDGGKRGKSEKYRVLEQ